MNRTIEYNPYKFSIGLRFGEHAEWSRSLIFCSSKNFFVIDALLIVAFIYVLLLHIDS